MAYKPRILLFTKPLNIALRYMYLNCTYKGHAFHEQCTMKFSTVGSSKFHLIDCSGVKNFKQPAKKLCAVAKNEISGIKETENAKDAASLRSLCEINLSDHDVMNTFRKLLQVYMANKYKRSSDFEDELQKLATSEEFKNFCNSLEKILPILSAQDLKLLLHCDNFQIPSSSVLMQKIYHLIIEKINDYTPIEMVSIYLTVNSASHRGDAKSKVLQLICGQYFGSKLFKDIYASKEYNKIASLCDINNVPYSVRRKLFTVLARNFTTIHDELTLNSLCHMFRAFKFKSLLPYFEPEMYDVLKARIIEKPTFQQMRNTLIGLKYLMPNDLSYDESFLDTLAEKALEKELNVSPLSELVIHFLQMEYLPLPLVEQMERAVVNPNFTLESHRLGLRLAKILSDVYYHPLGYSGDDSNHIECIEKLESLNFNKSDVKIYVKWCLYLTTLGSRRKIEHLNGLFNYLTTTYENTEDTVKLSDSTAEAIIALHAFARRNFPNDVVELSETFLKNCYDALQTELIKSIHQIVWKLLDSNTAVEYCTTSMYHFIDFAMLLNQENKPQEIAIDSGSNSSDSILRIENIKKPPLSRLILYQIYRGQDPCQFKNCPNLPGTVQLYLQSFEAFDCRVVLLHNKKLTPIPLKHEMSYLIENINKSLQ